MNFKTILKKLLFPPIWITTPLSVISAAALVFIFTNGYETNYIAYPFFVLSFYSLSVLCVFFSLVFPKKYKNIKAKVYKNPFGNRYLTDATFRTHVSLYISLSANLMYAAFNIVSFFLYSSMWFNILAGYYIILAVMRFLLLRYEIKTGIGTNISAELKRTVVCSYILLTVNLILSGAVLMIMYRNKGFEYNGILIYVMAAYTFYITTHAIISLIRYRKYKSPIMTMTKIISLSAALVSMLNLETAMLSSFGSDLSVDDTRLMIALTGAGVSIIVIALSLFVIINSKKALKTIKTVTINENNSSFTSASE